MQSDQHLEHTRAYYDDFSRRYEDKRGGREPNGYHDLVDDLEVDLVARYGTGRDVLEVGCGTGLLLERIARFASKARGVDLSPGMLEHARARGLDVVEGSATALPFEDRSFDVSCSFKVLAHVADLRTALSEMARVVRRGGFVLAELYNSMSLRALAKRLGPPGAIAEGRTEAEVFTRWDLPWDVERVIPASTRLVTTRGVRIVTPMAAALRVPVLGGLLRRAEWALCDSPLRVFGGFYVLVLEKTR